MHAYRTTEKGMRLLHIQNKIDGSNKIILTRVMTKINGSRYYHRQIERRQNKELKSEIECPRCYDTMTLNSDFDGLYYFCEQCDFRIYTRNRTPLTKFLIENITNQVLENYVVSTILSKHTQII